MRSMRMVRGISIAILICFAWMLLWPGIALAQQAKSGQPQNAMGLLASIFRHQKKTTISPEAQEVMALTRILNGAFYHLQKLLQQVEQGKPGTVSLVGDKLRSLKGLLSALDVHFNRMEENLSKLESKGIISAQKLQEAEGKIAEAKVPMGNLLAQLQGISSAKSDAENQALAIQALQTLQSLIQANNPLAQQLPNLKNFKLPNRTGFDLVQPQDPPDTQEIMQEEENDPTPPTGDTEDTHDPLKPGPPTAADLASTPDAQITLEIQTEAAQLGNDPGKILAYVHDNFFFEPYFGAEKGSQETFFGMGGDDTDQASLLIALLRAAGVPSRYETGVAVVKLDAAENWLSVNDPTVALNVLRLNGIPAATNSTSLVFQHTWVIAFLHRRWVRIDPSFKEHQFYAGVNPFGMSGLDVNTFDADLQQGATLNTSVPYFTNLNFTAAEQYAQQASDTLINIVDTQYPNYTMGQLFGGRAILPADETKLEKELLGTGKPSTLPYRIKKLLSISSDVSSDAHFTASFSIGGATLDANVEDIVNQKVWIEYQPATPQDAAIIQAAGGIYNVIPAYIVNMVPVLKVENQVIGTGSPVPLGSEQVLTSAFSEPNFLPDEEQKVLFAGATYANGLDAQRGFINPALSQRIQQAQTAVSNGTITDTVTSDVLFATAKAYFGFTDIQSENASKITNTVWSRSGPGEAVTANDIAVSYLFGLPYEVSPGGYSIDVRRNVVSPFSKTGTANDTIEWMVASGGVGSAEENLINEQVHQVASVSTIAVLQLASQAGIPIYLITQGNANQVLPLLKIDPGIVQFIAQAAMQGLFVVVPQSNVTLNQWTGTGFIVMDPTSGAAGYLLAGGIEGQLSLSNGGATSTGTPPLLTSASLDLSIQSSLNNQEQTSQDANAKTTPQPSNSAAIQKKKASAVDDFEWGGLVTVIGLAASKVNFVVGLVLVAAEAGLLHDGLYLQEDADKESHQ